MDSNLWKIWNSFDFLCIKCTFPLKKFQCIKFSSKPNLRRNSFLLKQVENETKISLKSNWNSSDDHFKNNTIICKKFATVGSGKIVKQPFVKRIAALVLTCFPLKKDRFTFFRPETIVASFLHPTVLLYKVIINHASKHHFVVFFCCSNWN